jgi:hypothetical protein
MNFRQTPLLAGLVAAALLLLRGPGGPVSTPPAGDALTNPPALASGGQTTDQLKTGAPSAAGVPPAAEAARREYARLYRQVLDLDAADETPLPSGIGAATTRVRGNLLAQPVSLDVSVQPKQAPVTDADLLVVANAARARGYRLEFMIALVADPIDSRLASDFDLAMIALQRGLAEADYRLDRKWLPWSEPDAAEQRGYREAAGMMLFRGGRAAPAVRPLLAVLVVGETPKAGIHKAAFKRAVELILALHPPTAGHAPSSPEIPVLGPTFSGSIDSLRLAIAGTPAAVRFRVVSGSAAAPGVERRLAAGGLAGRVHFSRTVVAEDLLATTAFEFLRERMGWNFDRAALLIEYDTLYGRGLMSRRIPLARNVVQLRFPSGLFALRNAWEDAGFTPPAKDVAANPKALPTARTALDVSLKDQGTPVDVVPELSPLTARIGDLTGANLLRQISREKISYVGILATDVKDELFLAEQIRRWAPNVIVFVFDSNLLFVHPQYNTTMFGALSISSFPLAPEGSREAPPPRDQYRRQFASALQEGTFLAVGSLLGRSIPPPTVWIAACGNYALSPLAKLPVKPPPEPPPWNPPGEPLGPRGSHDFRADAATAIAVPAEAVAPTDRLGLQLLVLTAVLIAASYKLRQAAFFRRASRTAATPRPHPGSPPRVAPTDRLGLQLLVLTAVLIAASYKLRQAAFFRRASRTAATPRPHPGSPPRRVFSWHVASPGVGAHVSTAAQRRTRHLLCGGIALLSLAATGLLLLHYRSDPVSLADLPAGLLAGRFDAAISYAGLIMFAILVAWCYLAWVFVQTTRLYTGATRWAIGFFGLLLPPLLAVGTFQLWTLDADGLFYCRASAFSSGLSPLVSLGWLLAALFLWLFVEVKRQLVRERHRTPWPLAGGKADAWRVNRLLDRTLLPNRWCLAALVVILPSTLVISSRLQPIGERVAYGKIFLALWALASLLGLVSFFRFLGTWLLLRSMLRRVAQGDGYLESLKHEGRIVGWNPMKFSWYTPSFAALEQSVERLQRLIDRRLAPPSAGRPGPDQLLDKIRKSCNQGRFCQEVEIQKEMNALLKEADTALAAERGRRGVERYYAARLITYLRHVFTQMRYATIGALSTGMAAIVAVATYAFEPKKLLLLIIWAILTGASITMIVVFVQMERDTALSAIGGTTPGKVAEYGPFLSKVLTYVVLPALTLIASQFPSIGRLIGSFLDPLARVLGTG